MEYTHHNAYVLARLIVVRVIEPRAQCVQNADVGSANTHDFLEHLLPPAARWSDIAEPSSVQYAQSLQWHQLSVIDYCYRTNKPHK